MLEVRSPRALFALATLAALTACGSTAGGGSGSAAPPSSTMPAPTEPARYVVFDTRTPLCREPRLDASCVKQARGYTFARAEGIARLIEDRGAWLRVETTDAWDVGSHCASAANGVLNQLGLHLSFFIQRSALLPIAEAQSIPFANGTGVTLRSGAPLLPPEAGVPADLVHVSAGFPLLLPRAAVKSVDSYVETPLIARAPQAREIVGGRTMRYGVPLPTLDFPPYPEGESRGTTVPEAPGVLRDPFDPTWVYAESPHEAGVLVELRSSCSTLKAIVAPDALQPAPRHRGHSGESAEHLLRGRLEQRTSRYRLRAGASLTYPDGAAAGRVGRFNAPFNGEERSHASGVCMVRGLFGDRPPKEAAPGDIEGAKLTLCASAADAMLWPRFWSDTQAATIHEDTKTVLVVEVDNRSELDAAALTRDVRDAVKDAFLIDRGFAMAPASLRHDEARAFAEPRGLGVVHVRLTVGRVQIRREPWGVSRSITAEITRPDGTTSSVPNLSGGSSPGHEDVVSGELTEAFLRGVFERSVEHQVAMVRRVYLAGDKPPDVSAIRSVDELPSWALPPGWSRP